MGQVKGAGGSRDPGDVNVREEGEKKVTEWANVTRRGGGLAKVF
jgi:hypothetical protein